MAKKGVVTRFGPRYGRTTREQLGKVESQYKGKQKCPHCSYTAVKRLAAGIWHCTKCDTKFTSRAYGVRKPLPIRSKTEEHADV
ncbi:50S ribosomal protein L37ae [Candidatus Woesearchaeota archaeon]|nr:50S ribosomal protein L37ae [Candidatus Woesearchaeota archaeon]